MQKLTFDTNLDTFITYAVPISVPIQKHIYEGSNNGESEHRRAATKAGEMKYFTLSPGFPSSSEVFCSTFFHKAVHDCSSPEITHACKCASTCINTARRTREETKYRKKRREETRFGDVFECVLLLHYSVLRRPLRGRVQGD